MRFWIRNEFRGFEHDLNGVLCALMCTVIVTLLATDMMTDDFSFSIETKTILQMYNNLNLYDKIYICS